VSDAPLPNIGSSGVEIADESVQRECDQFANPDLSNDRESHRAPLAIAGRSTTKKSLEMRVYDSSPAFESTTALGDAFARAQSTDPS
jgi:hypothetical protein